MQICSVVGCRIYLSVFRLQEERKLLGRKEFRAGPNSVQRYDRNLGKARNKVFGDQRRHTSLGVWPLLEGGWGGWGLEGTMTA